MKMRIVGLFKDQAVSGYYNSETKEFQVPNGIGYFDFYEVVDVDPVTRYLTVGPFIRRELP